MALVYQRTVFTALAMLSLCLCSQTTLAQASYQPSEADIQRLLSGAPVTHVSSRKVDGNKLINVYGAIDINAEPSVIWRIMTDCAQNFEIIKTLVKCKVLESDENGLWDIRKQTFKIGLFLPRAKTHFRSDYVLNESITIQRVGGDLAIQNAVWKLSPRKNGTTRVSYEADLKSKLPIPRRIIIRATEKDTPEILTSLKRVAEAENLAALSISTSP